MTEDYEFGSGPEVECYLFGATAARLWFDPDAREHTDCEEARRRAEALGGEI